MRVLRHRAHILLFACINRIVARCADEYVMERFMGQINNAGGDMFWFVPNPKISSPNNAAERGLL